MENREGLKKSKFPRTSVFVIALYLVYSHTVPCTIPGKKSECEHNALCASSQD